MDHPGQGLDGNETEYRDLIRLPQAELKKIIEQCSSSAERFPHFGFFLTVVHPGGTQARFQVYTLDVSARGLAFLHGGYLHEGSECSVVLERIDGEPITVSGRVANCTHIVGNVHRVGMEFDAPTDIGPLLNPDDEAGTLTGRLLLIEQSEPERELLKHGVRDTNIEVIGFSAAVDAMTYLHANRVERVMGDMATIEDSVTETVLSIRKADYDGPILLTASDPRSPALSTATELGAGPTLTKPFKPAELIVFLSENWLDQDEEEQDADAPDSEVIRLLESFMEQVRDLTRTLDTSTLGADYEQTLRVCHRLKGSGASFGFPEITKAASAAITALHAGGALPEATAELRGLREVCARIDPERSELLAPDR